VWIKTVGGQDSILLAGRFCVSAQVRLLRLARKEQSQRKGVFVAVQQRG
jgi:hypothetical protein